VKSVIRKHKKHILVLVLLLVLSYPIFRITFSTSIYGDEWKIFWLGESALKTKTNIFVQTSGDLSYIFEVVTFNYLSKFFGYNGSYYYIFSYLTRIFASFSFFLFLRKVNLKSMSAFIGSLLFMVTPIGIETTDWVRNFDSYLVIPLFLMLINFCLELKNKKGSVKILLLLTVIILVNTTRSHGVFFVLLGLLSYRYIYNHSYRKLLFHTFLSVIFIYFILSQTPIFGNQTANLFQNFRFKDFIYSFFGNIGNTLIPNVNSWLIKFNSAFYLGIISFLSLLTLSLTHIFRFNRNNRSLICLSLLLSYSFMLAPLIRIPQIRADSEHRYFIFSALVTPILISIIADKLFNRKLKIIFGSAVAFLLLIFAAQSYKYLNLQNWAHSQKYTESLWSKITSQINPSEVQGNSFIVLTNPESYPKVNSTVYFGSNYHLGLLYQIWYIDRLPEVWISPSLEFNKSNIPESLFLKGRTPIIFRIHDSSVERTIPTARP